MALPVAKMRLQSAPQAWQWAARRRGGAVAARERDGLEPAAPPLQQEGDYWLAKCAKVGCGLGVAAGEAAAGTVDAAAGGGIDSGTLWWDGTWCDT